MRRPNFNKTFALVVDSRYPESSNPESSNMDDPFDVPSSDTVPKPTALPSIRRDKVCGRRRDEYASLDDLDRHVQGDLALGKGDCVGEAFMDTAAKSRGIQDIFPSGVLD